MADLGVARPRTRGYSRLLKRIVRKKPITRFRGVPPPLAFDLDALPDSAMLNKTEVAAACRRSIAAVDYWLAHVNDFPLVWRLVSGRWLCEVSSVRALLRGTEKKGAEW